MATEHLARWKVAFRQLMAVCTTILHTIWRRIWFVACKVGKLGAVIYPVALSVKKHIIGIIGSLLAFVMIVFVVLAVATPNSFDPTTNIWKFWLQTLAGNWSPYDFPYEKTVSQNSISSGESPYSVSRRFWYAISAVVAVLLNNALYLFIIGALWRLAKAERKIMDMNVAKAINFKDDLLRLMMKSAMLKTEFSDAQQQEISDLFNAARAEANAKWVDRYLLPLLGPDAAEEILRNLNESVSVHDVTEKGAKEPYRPLFR